MKIDLMILRDIIGLIANRWPRFIIAMFLSTVASHHYQETGSFALQQIIFNYVRIQSSHRWPVKQYNANCTPTNQTTARGRWHFFSSFLHGSNKGQQDTGLLKNRSSEIFNNDLDKLTQIWFVTIRFKNEYMGHKFCSI